MNGRGGGGFPRVCDDEDDYEDEENDNEMTEGLTNSVTQRRFIRGSTRPRPPPSSAAGPLILIMTGPRIEGIASCDADGRGRARDPRVHDREDCSGERGEVLGSDGDDPPYPHPLDATISSPSGRGVEGDMKRVEEGSLEFLQKTDAARLRSSGRRDIDNNKNEILEAEEAPRAMKVAEMEGETDDDDGEDGSDGGDGGSP